MCQTEIRRHPAALGILVLASLCISGSLALGADFGRVSGSVADPQGNPLVGATVFVTGPVAPGLKSVAPEVDRLLTDALGKFSAEHLKPGWYTLRVTSSTRVPEIRDGVHVVAGETVQEKFVLADIFAHIRFQAPPTHLSGWGDDWKWVLRTSAATRPVLRLENEQSASANAPKGPLPADARLIAVAPGTVGREAIEGDQGMGAVLAYLRPLSADSDLLVASTMSQNGGPGASVATSLRRNLTSGNVQEVSLVVHELNVGGQAISAGARTPLDHAKAITAAYESTHRISGDLVVTSGIEMDYLNAASSVGAARPYLTAEYRPNGSEGSGWISMRVGSLNAAGGGALLDRVQRLSTLPPVTLRNNRLQLATINHAEASLNHKVGKSSKAELAAYHDGYGNAAVWGLGSPRAFARLAGNALPGPGNAFIINGGNFGSSGLRGAFTSNMGSHLEAAIVFETGTALAAKAAEASAPALPTNLREALSPERSQSVAGKVTARLPASRTQITTSYQWMQRRRVTGLDPYLLASLQLDPFLGIQIRQPIPTPAFFPAHIEALADLSNLLAQGYVPVSRGGQLLTFVPIYRSFRGGFSVEF